MSLHLQKLLEFLVERREFSYKTFGSKEERDHTAPLLHLQKEVQELIDNPDDPMEWADCVLLLLDAAERKGHSFNDLIDFASKKLEINKVRKWNKQPNGTFLHEKNTECPSCGGEGGVDSGGNTPWGSPIFIPCFCMNEEEFDLSSCEQCGEEAWDGSICHSCGMKHI